MEVSNMKKEKTAQEIIDDCERVEIRKAKLRELFYEK